MRSALSLRLTLKRRLTGLTVRCVSSATQGAASSSPSQRNVDVDICIVGGGIVGSCVAAALKRCSRTRHLRVALVDSSWPTSSSLSHETCGQVDQLVARPSSISPPASVRDRRVYAISPASRQLLQAVGAWQLLPADRIHNYDSMQVWQSLGAGVLQLKASDAGLESLGCIVEHSVLQAALKQCVTDSDVICIGSDSRSITSRPPAAAAAAGHVLSAGDFSVSCALLVGADGAASRVRAHSGIASAAMNYSSRAVVATLQLSESTSTAHQRFLSTGPIAMLPMDAGFASLVWTLPAHQAAQAVLLPADEFVMLINEAFRASHEGAAVLPPLVTGIEGKTAAVPLQLMQACRMQENSIVLVGDAAHAVHPLAGQGLNLGLHDALSLVAHISRASAAGGAADDFVALQAFERERLPANAAWGAAIDFIGRTFGVQASAIAVPRSFALSFLNAATPLKKQIILAASGEGTRHFENLEELK